MTGGISIGEGSRADLDAVMRVMDDSFDPAYGEAWTAPQCAGLLPMPGVWLSLARSAEEVVGFALSRIVLEEAELMLLAVKRNVQAHGIGRQLLSHFSDAARRRGATKLYLEVREGNSAVNLYYSFGFVEVGRRAKYYTGRDGQIYDALTLECAIAK
jgi:ribosomal-protein-alanine N-acetyltransferase